MTDGYPFPHTNEYKYTQAVQEVRKLEENGKLTIFPIGIGEEADMAILAAFSNNRPPLRLKGLSFCKKFFEWLSASVTVVSVSRPGERIRLDPEGIRQWSEI